MRDYVEVGIGREARRTHHLQDISLVPARRTRSSQDVDTTWHIDAYTFDIPVASYPTDALAGDVDFVNAMHNQGGLAVINAEGMWARQADIPAAIKEVITAAEISPAEATRTLQRLHAAPLDTDLLTERLREVRTTGATVAVRVSPQNARELAPAVVAAGAEILFIQGTIISAEHVAKGGAPLNLKEFIGSLEVPVIAGGVYDYSTAMHLMRTGAAGVIVGGTSAASELAVGIAPGMATAIADVNAARREYLDETGGRYVHILADAHLETSGDIARAIACGADAVMLGSPLAQAAEASASGHFWQTAAAHPRFPRGVVERDESAFDRAEPASLETILHGPSSDAFGFENLVGGLRRAMAKCGYTDLKSFQKVGLALA
ncbi:GuaB3 family IMP dehydrogenase-related protein [Corynebacterium yudongzhengii]|uniref:GuaB3 family IMP dehydrogenase-related protein n=1 Tax=Corynebacterium yudongzhengii TaxID=2080740 RepID=A0A2U1T6Y1_9CORY|nr:GuaB3 family IMP dehydrogenase-related protein [Corynebacterium yudongzhengii]AWB81314.1 GuaB3 family IMP dehydrogenase-related protein [Corynebacterium yudongzhengii]PWC01757.1 GuaB3 family IMP dehydrogenase-related protein [Corynebacterium yudongzhengii]